MPIYAVRMIVFIITHLIYLAIRDKLVGRILLQEKIDSTVLEHCRMRRYANMLG